MRTSLAPSAILLLLLVAVCSVAFLGCEATRCCAAAADDDVALATVADSIVLLAVVTVMADDDADDVDGTAASAAAIPASRRLRIKPTNQTICFPFNREKQMLQVAKIHSRLYTAKNIAHYKKLINK